MPETKSTYVAIDQTRFEVRNRDLPVSYVDVFTENRAHNGTICLSLGAVTVDGIGNEPIIEMVCRLRMNIVTAQVLHAELGRLIEASLARLTRPLQTEVIDAADNRAHNTPAVDR